MKITLFEGDGIGPEITESAKRVLDSLDVDIEYEPFLIGERAYKEFGELIPSMAYESIKRNKIALKAPVTTPIGKGFRSVNVELRLKFNLYANIRPSITLPNTNSRYDNINIVIVRENTEDLYAGIEKDTEDGAESIKRITYKASERIIRYAFDYAVKNNRKRVTCVHKANIMKKSDGLFLNIFNEIKNEYKDIEADSKIIDNMCMQLVMYPEKYDVIVAPNLYGDILSDLVAGLTGGLGIAPGANIGDDCAIFEAVHGSAPDIAGKGIANPIALLQTSAMMLDYMHLDDKANLLRKAIYMTLSKGKNLTRDLGGVATTKEITDDIINNIKILQNN